MSALRTLSVVLAFAAAVGLIFGTAGFSAMNADRGLGVNVTSDESASIGYEPLADTVHDGDSTPVVEYRNRFNGDLDEFDVTVSMLDPEGTNASITSTDAPSDLPSVTSRQVDITLSCPVETAVDLRFEASGSGAGISVSLHRVHTVTCTPNDEGEDGGDENDGDNESDENDGDDESDGDDEAVVTGVHFNNAANADIGTEYGDGTVVATVWTTEPTPVDNDASIEPVTFDAERPLDTAEKLRPEVVEQHAADGLSNDWKIVAVEFPGQEIAFLHPQWDAGEYDAPKTGDGAETTVLPLDAEQLLGTSAVDEGGNEDEAD